jgi:pyruvate,orthophosphate dikinase
VTIRTLDPPLHEFLPHDEGQMELAKSMGVKPPRRSRPSVHGLHEFNPMLGHRGCRLGIVYPEITEMQARAIFEAAADVAKKGIKVQARGDDPARRLREGAGPPGRRRPRGGRGGAWPRRR